MTKAKLIEHNFGKMVLTMPVFNEAEVIEEVVRQNLDYISQYKNGYLLISEDGSNDGTKEILKKLQKKLGFILYSSSKRKGAAQGQRDAVGNALKEGADIILITDSDNQHDPNDFDNLLKLYPQADMVTGQKIERHDPLWRILGSKVWNWYIGVMFGLHMKDVNTGFRVIRAELAKKMLPVNHTFDGVVLTEMAIRAKYAGYRIKETPVSHRKRDGEARAWKPSKMPAMMLGFLRSSFKLKKELEASSKKTVRDTNRMDETYSSYYDEEYSFRSNWFGPITQEYIIPKYFNLLDSFIPEKKSSLQLLEIGAGDGEITDYIKKKRPNWHIVPTEPIEAAVSALKRKGYTDAKLVSATEVPFPDNSFDYVICFDVMHHVDGPAQMAREMMRVARKGVFLIEANRAAIVRRILEHTETYKKAGEFSYYPIEYKAFFNIPSMKSISIEPFQFIPPKLSHIHLGLTIFISEMVSKIPLLKWQCSGLAIKVQKK